MITEADRVEVEPLFGERKVFLARVCQADFARSRVRVEED